MLFTVSTIQSEKKETKKENLLVKLQEGVKPLIYVDGRVFDFPMELIDQSKIASVMVVKKQDAIKENEFSNSVMPTLKKGDPLHCTNTQIIDKQTSPPKHFNDASLLSAMTGIARYVNDPDIRKTLRETDGLGTEATRAGIIELLFARDYLIRKGKDIHATEIGQQLINSLPDCVALPDMTAQWESQLNDISQRKLAYPQFMHAMTQHLNALITATSGVVFYGLKGKGKAFVKRRRKRKAKAA